jgi:hypothetical protein
MGKHAGAASGFRDRPDIHSGVQGKFAGSTSFSFEGVSFRKERSLGKFQGLDDVWLGTSSLGLELIDRVDTFPGELNILASGAVLIE